jgi:hypothetical protein
VFHWGREVDVNWRMVSWVTIRDQVGLARARTHLDLDSHLIWTWTAGLFVLSPPSLSRLMDFYLYTSLIDYPCTLVPAILFLVFSVQSHRARVAVAPGEHRTLNRLNQC